MEAKTLEIRDRATMIPVLAVRPGLGSTDYQPKISSDLYLRELRLWNWSGYGAHSEAQNTYVVLVRINDFSGLPPSAHYDSYSWTQGRTMKAAHEYIIDHWDALQTGDVVDVQFILGETAEPKVSELR